MLGSLSKLGGDGESEDGRMLGSLTKLVLDWNVLHCLPSAMPRCHALRHLFLAGNQLASLPPCLSAMAELRSLLLSLPLSLCRTRARSLSLLLSLFLSLSFPPSLAASLPLPPFLLSLSLSSL